MKRSLCQFGIGKLELRTDDKGNSTLAGLAIPYEQWSEPIYGYFREKFARNAFTDSLKSGNDVYCDVEHDPNKILARSSSNTLKLAENGEGVSVECIIPNTSYGVDLVENVRHKNIKGMSFIFDSIDEDWGKDDGFQSRYIKKANLYEVCFTCNPAYPGTTVNLRSLMNEADIKALAESKIPLQIATVSKLTEARARMLKW